MADVASGPTVLVAHPAADVYGSDLQLLESISGLADAGWRVVVAMPEHGPLHDLVRRRGGEPQVVDFPVLRRASSSAGGLAGLAVAGVRAATGLRRVVRQVGADVLYVNTVTLPWWLTAGRLARVPTLCHVHEAEDQDPWPVRAALGAPLLQAHRLIVISRAASAAAEVVPGLRRRARLIYNGVPQPETAVTAGSPGPAFRLAVVGRLSPRKAPHVALEAVALLRAQGREVTLEVCGTAFAGYEAYESELRERAEQDDLRGAVQFSGYVSPIWSVLERADVVVAPSLREPFGNAVVEAQLAGRPVVAAAALGHLETIEDGVTGLLTPPGDAEALARAVATLMDDPSRAASMGERARLEARRRFSVERYQREVVELVTSLVP